MKKRTLLVAAAGLLGTVLLLLPCPTAAKSANFSNIPRLARTSRFSPGLLPFSFNQVLSCFDNVFQKSGHRAVPILKELPCKHVEILRGFHRRDLRAGSPLLAFLLIPPSFTALLRRLYYGNPAKTDQIFERQQNRL